MKRGTSYVLTDEKAMALYELNFKSPDQKERRRYEIIEVIRDGEVAEYRRDLGNAKTFPHDQIRIPSFMEHTVGELREIANSVRFQPSFDKKELLRVNRLKLGWTN